MNIDLSSVVTSPKQVKESFGSGEIDLEDEGKLKDRATLFGTIWRDANRVHLRGRIDASVEVACSRCLEAVEEPLALDFEDVFVDSDEESGAEEAEVPAEALDEELVENGTIDLAEIVREQIILGLSETPLCRDDCRGLCPNCGENRNLIDCKCESDDIDPRWAALRNLN